MNVIVMADYALVDNPDAMVIGVDADGVSYILEDGGSKRKKGGRKKQK